MSNRTNKTIEDRFDEKWLDDLFTKESILSFFNQELLTILEELRMGKLRKIIGKNKKGFVSEDVKDYNLAVQRLNANLDKIIKREGLEIKK